MKYYAIRQIEGVVYKEILTSWEECKPVVTGKMCEYKSFAKESDAIAYLESYVEEPKEEEILNNKDNYIYYVDGSYKGDMIGWGFVLIKDNTKLTQMCGGLEPNEDTSRNITGELEATKMAVRHALANDFKNITIIYDYQGIGSYVNGSWKPKTNESKAYLNWMNKTIEENSLNVSFVKVKGHSDNKWNDEVDTMAKKGCTL